MVHGGRLTAMALAKEGVSHLFTLCGGHIQHIYDGCLDEGIRVVDFRHEQSAAHAAEGWARATGQPGVCAITAGPGVTGTVTAVATAFRGGAPMVVLGGQGPNFARGMGSLQEMDHVTLMRSITKWSTTVHDTSKIRESLATAFRKATTGVPGPVFVELPLDVLMGFDKADEGPQNYRTTACAGGDPELIHTAAGLLKNAQRPVAIVGTQWWWSPHRQNIGRFVSHFDVPTFLNGAARGALPPTNPHTFRSCRSEALSQADVVVVFGTPWDFRLKYGTGLAADAQVIQVDLDGAIIGHNRGAEVGLVGDNGLIMGQLCEQTGPRQGPDWLQSVRQMEHRRFEQMKGEMNADTTPINPLRFSRELAEAIPPEATVVCDGGDIVGTAAKLVATHQGGHWMDPGPLGTLGVGPGYAMAAKLARPEAPVVVIYGDGAFGLNAMEFEAAVRQNIPFVGVVGNDAAWTQIRRGQVQIFGEERSPATSLGFVRYDRMVEALGGYGEWVEAPSEVGPAIQRALESGRPALVNVKIGKSDFRAGSISV